MKFNHFIIIFLEHNLFSLLLKFNVHITEGEGERVSSYCIVLCCMYYVFTHSKLMDSMAEYGTFEQFTITILNCMEYVLCRGFC